ncbi:MAG: hypothetical protein HRU24_07650 [Gammaproteobacteria bacterium]|nr:hypothetical protein [Gammaproteobacteria bacterium]
MSLRRLCSIDAAPANSMDFLKNPNAMNIYHQCHLNNLVDYPEVNLNKRYLKNEHHDPKYLLQHNFLIYVVSFDGNWDWCRPHHEW